MNSIPDHVFSVSEKLKNAGYECFLVGGSLRDLLLGKTPKDYDFATNAFPEDVARIFKRTVLTGAKYGTVIVLVYDEHKEIHEIEVTTYRKESDYIAGRWPSKVEFTSSLHEDLSRRDFTINAMALDISRDINFVGDIQVDNDKFQNYLFNHIKDFYNGIEDLKNGVIRAVGNPLERFSEDGLRPIRACRMASVLNFQIDDETFNAIPESINIVKMVSKERVRDELNKIILNSDDPSIGIELLRKSGILQEFIPELLEGYGMYQNKYHSDNVYHHLLKSLDIADKDVRLAALFHDIGKPRCKVGGTFYGHDIVGSKMSFKILRRLKYPKKTCHEVSQLVRWHMFNFEHPLPKSDKDELDLSKRNKLVSDSAIRRLLRNIGGHDNMDKLIRLRVADASSNSKNNYDPSEATYLGLRVAKIRLEESILSISDLDINGYDLMENGIPEGKTIRVILNHLLELITEDPLKNSKETLIKEALNYYSELLGKENK